MNTSGKTIGEFLDSIMTSDFVKKLIPKVEELDTTMSKMVNAGDFIKIVDNGLDKTNYEVNEIKQALEPLIQRLATYETTDTMKIKNIVSNINETNIKDSIESLKKIGSQDEKFGKVLEKTLEKTAKTKITPDTVASELGKVNYFANIPKAYFSHPDSSVKKARVQGVIGGYAAISIGGRLLNGGTLTTDSYGRKDIAGVPFI